MQTTKQSHHLLKITLLKITMLSTYGLMAAWCAPHAQAEMLYSYQAGVAGGGTNAQAPGQEVTTLSGGPWNDITFNFYDGDGNAVALETVFLLSEPYSGTASALSSSTPGFIAEAVGGGLGGVYAFDSSVILQPDTAYYFYDSALSSGEWGNNANFSAIGSGYQGYGAANGGSSSYTARPFAQAFNLSGNVVVPEPSAATLMFTALLAFGVLGGRRKNKRHCQLVFVRPSRESAMRDL